MRIYRLFLGAVSLTALTSANLAVAQTVTPDKPAEVEPEEILVTASRIDKAGFDQPTPTTVVGEVDLRQGARPNLGQILNDLPQFRATISQQIAGANVQTGVAAVDLRGLGVVRSLTLIDGRRFVGQGNLNFIPTNLVGRIEVVTGGASAAWGSGAVAGVVNVILNDKLEGLTVGGSAGISSRNDGRRYSLDSSYGVPFADGRGHVIAGVEYVEDKGVSDAKSRPNIHAGIVRVNPTSTTDLSTRLVRDVNYGNLATDGLITSGVLAGMVFNPDGTLRPFRGGTQVGAAAFNTSMIGGADGTSVSEHILISAPFRRLTSYARATYELDGAEIWADVSYANINADNPAWIPDTAPAILTVSASNPFLSTAIRSQLSQAGQTTFSYGRDFSDILSIAYEAKRENKEAAAGVDGNIGTFKYRAHVSYGEISDRERLPNSRITANFNRAINAVNGTSGQIVCAVNADANTTNDDPNCRPFNIFGPASASAEALDYVTGTQGRDTTTSLLSGGFEIQGDLIDLWAGALTVAGGVEARQEKTESLRTAETIANTYTFPFAASDLAGKFSVKEAFAEAMLPILDVPGAIEADVTSAARYSDYSTTGGVWAWKVGGTLRLFDDLLLRGTRSRDVRAPTITDLFSTVRLAGGIFTDLDTAGRLGIPGYNPTPPALSFLGGNPDLEPEISKGLTLGATWSPDFLNGFSASVDYYDVRIDNAILTLNAASTTLACGRGNQAACANITRNPTTQTVETVFANVQNIARFETRGLDVEVAYTLPLSTVSANWLGSLRFRALATHIDRFIVDTGATRIDSAGDIGANTANSNPDWKGSFSMTYQGEKLSVDTRLRYIGSGNYNSQLTTLVNNRLPSKTYVDVGAYFNVNDKITLYGNVNNLFDTDPPLSPTFFFPIHDVIGTYFTAGARVKF